MNYLFLHDNVLVQVTKFSRDNIKTLTCMMILLAKVENIKMFLRQ